MISLAQLKKDQTAKVVDFELGFGCKQKLQNLGIRKGVTVKKIAGLFSHGPLVIMAGRAQIALGRKMASKVMVEVI